MARDDIMPWDSANGGTSRTNNGYITASQTFDRGEPVFLTQAGTITECVTDPIHSKFLGIAAAGPGTANTNPDTGTTTWPVGTQIPIWIPIQGDKFITDNYSEAEAAGFGDVAPVVSDIGNVVGLELIGDDWGVCADATNNIVRIYDVLNKNKDPIRVTGETLTASTAADSYYVVFEILGQESLPVTGLAVLPGA
jgi:hypothetical protein